MREVGGHLAQTFDRGAGRPCELCACVGLTLAVELDDSYREVCVSCAAEFRAKPIRRSARPRYWRPRYRVGGAGTPAARAPRIGAAKW